MARSLETQLHHTTSYHPQSNVKVEFFHRSLKASLRARSHDDNWIYELSWVLIQRKIYRPHQMTFGDSPLLPDDFSSSEKAPFCPSFSQTSTSSTKHHRINNPTPLPAFARSKYVFVHVGPQHPSLQKSNQSSFKVIQPGNKTFKVLMNKGSQTVCVDSRNLRTFLHRHEQAVS